MSHCHLNWYFIIGEIVDHLYVSLFFTGLFIFSFNFEITLCILGNWLFTCKMNCKFFILHLILFFFSQKLCS